MQSQSKPTNGPQAGLAVHAVKGGPNALLFVLTQDLVKGYESIMSWLDANAGYKLGPLMVAPAAIQTNTVNLNGQATVQGFGITAVCERVAAPVPGMLLSEAGNLLAGLAGQLDGLVTMYEAEALTPDKRVDLDSNPFYLKAHAALNDINDFITKYSIL